MKMENDKISAEFTKNQFLALMKMVYLGKWMANAQREDDFKDDYEDIKNYIFANAHKFGLDEFVSHKPGDGDNYYSSWKFTEETDVDYLHDEYDDNNFWDAICERFGERDFEKKYTKKEIQKMSADKRMDELAACTDKWGEEFNNHGIARLEVKE